MSHFFSWLPVIKGESCGYVKVSPLTRPFKRTGERDPIQKNPDCPNKTKIQRRFSQTFLFLGFRYQDILKGSMIFTLRSNFKHNVGFNIPVKNF